MWKLEASYWHMETLHIRAQEEMPVDNTGPCAKVRQYYFWNSLRINAEIKSSNKGRTANNRHTPEQEQTFFLVCLHPDLIHSGWANCGLGSVTLMFFSAEYLALYCQILGWMSCLAHNCLQFATSTLFQVSPLAQVPDNGEVLSWTRWWHGNELGCTIFSWTKPVSF